MGKQSVYTLLQNLPIGTKVVVVRNKGLRGSIFSKAYFGTPVPFAKMLVSAFWFVLANAVFWIPRRKVSIYIQDQTDLLLSQAKNLTMTQFNASLQERYNTP